MGLDRQRSAQMQPSVVSASMAALVLEEGGELRTGLVGRLLRGIVTARQHPAANIASPLQPRLDWLVAAIDVAALAPEHQHRNIELVLQIRLVVGEIDLVGGAIIFADRVNMLGR